tara:strand:- start:217 stop:1362 length:1146 start_codon:yes stop_codon:yes gene_type:complete
MKRRFKLKIDGESPRSLLLAFFLAKLNCDVYLYNFIKNTNSKKDYQILLISNSLKYLLSKFKIWNEIEKFSYSFTSLSIKDNLVSEQILLRTENFSDKYLYSFGWSAKYSDIKSLLMNKLINFKNVYFISKKQLIDETLVFDYEFNFKNYFKNLNFFKLPIPNSKREDEQILIFNVYLRGQVEKRLYKIKTTKGLIIFIPIKKNLYQIIWNNPSIQIIEISHISKSFFLDNLTTLLPSELKIDQIIGEINFLDVNNKYLNCLIENNSIYFNENKFKSNTIYDFKFDIIIRYILKIYNFLENNKPKRIKILNKIRFFFLLRKYLEIKINLSFFNLLINLFTINNIFSLFFRKLLFILLKRLYLIKSLFIRNDYKSNIDNLIK